MNEWMVKTHHLIQQMRKLRPRGRKGPVQSQGWKPRMSTYSICLSPQLFDLRKDRYGYWELAPFDNDFNDGSDAFLFIYLIWLSDNFWLPFPNTNNSSTTLNISHAWPLSSLLLHLLVLSNPTHRCTVSPPTLHQVEFFWPPSPTPWLLQLLSYGCLSQCIITLHFHSLPSRPWAFGGQELSYKVITQVVQSECCPWQQITIQNEVSKSVQCFPFLGQKTCKYSTF